MLAPEWWKELKYQTQYGPEYTDFPYFPAALEFDALARNAINSGKHRFPVYIYLVCFSKKRQVQVLLCGSA
jgi:hypothetical protein